MATKSKQPPAQDNVVIPPIEDETDNPATPAPTTEETAKAKKPRKPRDPNATPYGKKHCPHCNELIWVGARQCEYCKKDIPIKDKNSTGSRIKRVQNELADTKAQIETIKDKLERLRKMRLAFLSVLRGKNYNIKSIADELDPDATPQLTGPKEILELIRLVQYGTSQPNPKGLILVSSENSLKFEVDLDTLLAIAKIPPGKLEA